MAIFQRSLMREFTAIGVSVVGVLIAIMLINSVVALLGKVAKGGEEPEALTALLGFTLLFYLPVILALGLFLAVLLTLSRCYRESEMSVWFSSGLSIAAWVRPVLQFSLPVIAVIAFLSLYLTPWAWSESAEYRRFLRSKDDVTRLSPGSFVESGVADRVFFIDKTTSDAAVVNNVFMQHNQNGRFSVVVAEKGYQEIDRATGDKFLVLQNGRRYEGTPSGLDFRIVDFTQQKIRIEANPVGLDKPLSRQLPTLSLLANPSRENIAELHWRIALPIAALVLALMAVPLSFVSPRTGATWSLFLGMLVFFLYYNLLGVFQSGTTDGKIPLPIGLMPVHVMMVFLLLVLFSRQLFSFRWLIFRR